MEFTDLLLIGIFTELKEMNDKIDKLAGTGSNTSISDICNKLDDVVSEITFSTEEIKGNSGLYDSLSDVCEKIEEIKGGVKWGPIP